MTAPLPSRVPPWLLIWAALTALMILIRPAIPLDETRYLAVAWEMWWRHSVAVPFLNGAYYDGKPPLLFWLMHLGWLAAGVNDWWPRLVAPLAGLASLALVRAIAARLWPGTPAAKLAPLILLGSLLWALFCASTMFDTLLGAFALASVYWVVRAAQEGGNRHFAAAGLSLGLGILAKGPVVFLPPLWIVLSAPWWMSDSSRKLWRWPRWYGGGLIAALIAGVIAALWLVPMALSSDSAYVNNMLFHQTAGYVSESFSHKRPVWWYLLVLPVALLPWTAWPAAWRSVAAATRERNDPGLRLCIAWAAGVFVTFSLISGKQAHYLLLVLPAIALLLARTLPGVRGDRDRGIVLPAILIALAAAAVVAVASGWKLLDAAWARTPPPQLIYAVPVALIAIAGFLVAARRWSIERRVAGLTTASCAAILALIWATALLSGPAYDVRPASAYLARLAQAGEPLAFTGHYDGQFNFYGRIKARFQELEPADAVDWARRNPSGHLVAFYPATHWPPKTAGKPQFTSLYRGGGVAVWAARDIIAEPELAQAFR